jgi:F-type H+-transporting ATPase subunit epsilon
MILEIVSAESKLFSGEVTSVSAPGIDGSFQLLNNHAAIVSILKSGFVKISGSNFLFTKEANSKFIKINDQNYNLPIQSGTLEMKNNKVVILVD